MKGIIFLTRFLVGLSHSREHKFKQSFLDTLNPMYPCGSEIETLSHLFLHGPLFTSERQIFLHRIENINKAVLNKIDDCIIHILPYGEGSFPFWLRNLDCKNIVYT